MVAGVYCLRLRRSGLFYIGSSLCLERRRRDWRKWLSLPCLDRGGECCCSHPRLCRARRGTRAEDWTFTVVEDWGHDPHVPSLRHAERKRIAAAVRSMPELCVNGVGAWRGYAVLKDRALRSR